LTKLLSEEELSKLPEAPLMPFDSTARFEQAVPFGLQEYLYVKALQASLPPVWDAIKLN
jgi:hypothetical protein